MAPRNTAVDTRSSSSSSSINSNNCCVGYEWCTRRGACGSTRIGRNRHGRAVSWCLPFGSWMPDNVRLDSFVSSIISTRRFSPAVLTVKFVSGFQQNVIFGFDKHYPGPIILHAGVLPSSHMSRNVVLS